MRMNGEVFARTKTEAALETIRAGIESGRYGPEFQLRPHELADELGMSATPVREALRQLQAEGLIVSEPHHPMRVRSFSPERVGEVYGLRIMLEPVAARWGAEHASDDDVLAVQAAHERFLAAVKAGDPAVGKLNTAWHRTVYAPSPSELLREFIERLWTAQPPTALFVPSQHAKLSAREHEAITNAFAQRDASTVEQLMVRHLESGRERGLRRAAGNPKQERGGATRRR
jgi:DNA-binding GntR family transcriptional regulator